MCFEMPPREPLISELLYAQYSKKYVIPELPEDLSEYEKIISIINEIELQCYEDGIKEEYYHPHK